MGGTVRTVLNVANFLAEHNYDVEIVSVFRRKAQGFFEIDPRIKVTVLHDGVGRRKPKGIKDRIIHKLSKMKSRLIHREDEAYQFFSLLTDIKLYSFIKSINSGILITTRPSFNIFAAKYANKGVKLVGQEHLNFEIYPESLKQAIKANYGQLDYLITLTDEDTKDYQALFANKNVDVRKITNSIPKLNPVVAPLEEKVVLAAGRLVPQKGFDLLIDSFKKVVEKHPDWKLKIFGYGRDHAMLQQQILDNRLYNNVMLMGATKDIDNELANSSIYALSSRYEGFGMVIVEAMQIGVPVVSFDCPKGPAEIITDNEDGILVENGNVEKFADALLKLIEDKELRKRFGQNGLKNVKRFEIDTIGKLWVEFLEEINDKKPE